MVKFKNVPIVTILLCAFTVIWSLSIGILHNGEFFSKVPANELPKYGGITVANLFDLEIWRLLVSQFIHVKPYHMVYNVASLAFIGAFLEPKIGRIYFALTWFFSGALGTLYSSMFVPEPWNAGSGGSQAVLGLCGMVIVLYSVNNISKLMFRLSIFLCVIPAFGLDFIFAHYPKPGHVLSIFLGMLFGVFYVNVFVLGNRKIGQ